MSDISRSSKQLMAWYQAQKVQEAVFENVKNEFILETCSKLQAILNKIAAIAKIAKTASIVLLVTILLPSTVCVMFFPKENKKWI